MAELGAVDVLVNNAGVGPHPQPFQQLSEAEYDRVMDVNAKGVIRTTLHEGVVGDLSELHAASEEATWKTFLDRTPLGRLQETDDIAEMVVFLASERARNITGSAYNVNGGVELN